MELSLSPVSSKLSSLLIGTRIVKKFLKGANKIHVKLERDYFGLSSICDPSKCMNFKDIFLDYLGYIKSFLNFNEEIIKNTRTSYEALKRATLEIKSKISIVKVEKKSLKRMKSDKNDENSLDILKRCKDLTDKTSLKVKQNVEEAINFHLISLKHMKFGSSPEPHSKRGPYLKNSCSNLNFEDELEESIQKKYNSKVESSYKKSVKIPVFRKKEESLALGVSMKYNEDFSKVFD
jgi:hypothetical protein